MKKFILFFVPLLIYSSAFSQDYTWVKGTNMSGLAGVYGTMGVPAPTNNPGGRHGCGKWVDASGNLWLFGGEGYSSSTTLSWTNDLWKYNIATNTWTWIRGSNGPNQIGSYGTQGVPSSTNEPGAREFPACWTDASGNFWMFGGDGYASTSTFGRLGDLWKYDPTANQWTWIKGFNTIVQTGVYGTLGTPAPTNVPGSRYGPGVWKDIAGDLWMFGGLGYGASGFQGYLNDLWKYNIASNQWTWVSGTSTTNQLGLYGTLSVPSTTNAPGGKYLPASWTDASGNFYMFGGSGFSSVTAGNLNDLWKYIPSANAWVWIKGSSGVNQNGAYGIKGVSSPTNTPGGRFASAGWIDGAGNLWLYGGLGLATSILGDLDDLFRYKPGTNEWTWMKGDSVVNQNGVYGTQGITAPTNNPGGRTYNTWWKDQTGKFWLYGGEGYDAASTTVNHMNDLWSFAPPCNPDSISITPGKMFCTGNSATLTAFNGYPGINWYSSPTATSSIGSGSVFSSPPLTAVSSQVLYSYYAASNSCTTSPRMVVTLTVNPLPVLSINGPTTVCIGVNASYTVTGALTYTWNTGATSATNSVVPALPGFTFVVLGTDINGCENVITKTITVNPLPTVTAIASQTMLCKGQSLDLTALGANTFTWNTVPSQTTNTINVHPTQTTTYMVTGRDSNGCGDTAEVVVKVVVCPGFKEISSDYFGYSIYPNPNLGEFTFKVETDFTGLQFMIVNALGQKVFEQIIDADQTTIRPNLARGVYYCRVLRNGKAKPVGKLLIE